uniref:non-specific serine/threonine protein kinase n=2 Tax=Setaria TaxID=4554 RepID=K3ZC91_SETIT|nr:hypothetical protein SEVIR_3G202200v2 [Setaria viridis]
MEVGASWLVGALEAPGSAGKLGAELDGGTGASGVGELDGGADESRAKLDGGAGASGAGRRSTTPRSSRGRGRARRRQGEIYINDIQERILSELGGFTNLIGLDLHSNRISEPIPLALGNIESLKFLDFFHDAMRLLFLPAACCRDLSSNDLCGTIPTSGAFKDVPSSSFANSPWLHQGGKYEANC